MIILLDNGHGFGTPGKRSPDGHFREYAEGSQAIVNLHVEGILHYLSL